VTGSPWPRSTVIDIGAELGSNGNDSSIASAPRQGSGNSLRQTGSQVTGRNLTIRPSPSGRGAGAGDHQSRPRPCSPWGLKDRLANAKKGATDMKFVVIAAIVPSSISLARFLGTPTYGSVGRAPDSLNAKALRLKIACTCRFRSAPGRDRHHCLRSSIGITVLQTVRPGIWGRPTRGISREVKPWLI
jgi:hypothetical protein